MLDVTMTEQEKKDLAVIYGFLVDVWAAQQSKSAVSSAALKQTRRNASGNNTNKPA